MFKHLFAILFLMVTSQAMAQSMSASELLEKAINYHDPNGEWDNLQQKLFITMSYPDGRKRLSEVSIDLPKEYFSLRAENGENVSQYTLVKGECSLMLNGGTDFSEEEKQKHRLNCERAESMKNYYQYLYGLPMKLKDKGTQLSPTVATKKFKGKKYKVLKVTYDEAVGKDTWYFYFDPATYAMEVYQFFHDESKNDGEYILLSETEHVGTIKMPKVREWYYNKDDKHLGTDTLTKSEPLE